MRAISANELRNNQKRYLDEVVAGDTFIVNRKSSKNVVVLSEDSYNNLLKAKDALNSVMIAKIEKGYEDIKAGKGITFSMDELERMIYQ